MKKFIIWLLVIIIIGAGIYFVVTTLPKNTTPTPPIETATTTENTPPANQNKDQTVIGKSVGGNDIVAYHFGTGSKELLFIGGIHGGYEWNTVLVAQELIDYLKQNPSKIPSGVKVTVIPVLNPDGLKNVVGTPTADFTAADVPSSQETQIAGRFNGNKVDLNRNFACDWQPSGKWQSRTVSGGSKAFSEPESQAIKTYVETNKPTAVVAYFSAAGGVYSSSCSGAVSAETTALTNLYAKASGYQAYKSFDLYVTTGDMTNWLAKNNIPAISVLLTNHTDTEWSKNQKGIEAVLANYSK
jgi:hypothetical protein